MFWCVSYRLGAFGTVRMPYETWGKTGRTCKSSCHEVASEFFVTNPPNPLHWSLNLCFGVFRTIWVYLRPFGCLTKLRAKRSELVQKFMPRIRVGFLCNESTRSTPWDLKLLLWCISYHLDPFGTIRLPYETQGKTGRTSAKVRATMLSRIFFTTNAPDRPHWTINSCFWCVS